MAKVIVTVKLMPESPEVDLDKVKEAAEHPIKEFGGEVGKVEIEPLAFGLKALILMFVMDESVGSTETLEETLSKLEGVKQVEVTDVRRTIG